VLRVRVRGDGGGGDGDLHWLSLSFYSIRLSPPGGSRDCGHGHASAREVGLGLFGLSWIPVEHWA
jgi:hypothetical protein